MFNINQIILFHLNMQKIYLYLTYSNVLRQELFKVKNKTLILTLISLFCICVSPHSNIELQVPRSSLFIQRKKYFECSNKINDIQDLVGKTQETSFFVFSQLLLIGYFRLVKTQRLLRRVRAPSQALEIGEQLL